MIHWRSSLSLSNINVNPRAVLSPGAFECRDFDMTPKWGAPNTNTDVQMRFLWLIHRGVLNCFTHTTWPEKPFESNRGKTKQKIDIKIKCSDINCPSSAPFTICQHQENLRWQVARLWDTLWVGIREKVGVFLKFIKWKSCWGSRT